MKKNYLNYLLAITLFFGFSFMQVHAQAMQGSGTETDPFIITTAQHLNDIRDYGFFDTPHFKLANDIDLSTWISSNTDSDVSANGWLPIPDFIGVLDGNGFIIKNLWMSRTNGTVGLFATIDGAVIKKLGIIIDPAKSVKGDGRVGALVGQIPLGSWPVTIEECYVIGKVESTADRAGGLVGDIKATTTIKRCYSNGIVQGVDRVGGIVGGVQFDLEDNLTENVAVTIDECYSASNILTTAPGSDIAIGGIAGHLYWHSDLASKVTISLTNCLAANLSIKGPDATRQWSHRRMWGWAQESDEVIQNGNRGYNEIAFNGTDKVSGESGGRHGTDITAEEIVLQSSYPTWDFANTWQMYNGAYQLPILKNLNLTNQPQAALSHIGPVSSVETIKGTKVRYEYVDGLIYLHEKADNVPVELYTLSGSKVFETRNSTINISGFAKGIYVVKVGTGAFKLIK